MWHARPIPFKVIVSPDSRLWEICLTCIDVPGKRRKKWILDRAMLASFCLPEWRTSQIATEGEPMSAETTSGVVTTPPPRSRKKPSEKPAPKGKTRAKDSKSKDATPNSRAFWREAFGLCLLLIAAAVFLALVSFEIADLDAEKPANLIGPLGVKVGGGLLYVFGIASFFVNIVLAHVGLNLVLGRLLHWKIGHLSGMLLFVLSGAILGHLLFEDVVVLGHIPGGLLGEVSAEGLRSVVGTAGAGLVGFGGLTLSLMLVGSMSLGALTRVIIATLHKGQAFVRHQLRVQRETRARFAAEKARLRDAEEDDVVGAEVELALTPIVPESYAFEEGMDEVVEQKLSDRLQRLAKAPKPKSALAPTGNHENEVAEAAVEDVPKKKLGKKKSEKSEPAVDVRELISQEIERDSNWEMGEVLVPDEVSPPTPIRIPTVKAEAAIELEVSDSDIVDLVAERPSPQQPKLMQHVDVDFGPQIVESEAARKARERREWMDESGATFRPQRKGNYELPSSQFLNFERSGEPAVDPEQLRMMAAQIEKTLSDFKVDGQIVEICPGPVITMFEFSPGPGLKISRIAGLQDDLAMALSAHSVRILAPIPGKGVVGIEVPNPTRETVYLKEVITDEAFSENKKMELPLALGFDTEGGPVVADLAKMPHLLVAGATGAGKSVAVNTMIVSLLYKHTPDDVRFLMVDPKMLEFSIYADIPHLLLPVVTDPKQATVALNWAVQEMERRYQKLSEMAVRNIKGYNDKVERLTKQAELDQLDGVDASEALRILAPDSQGKPAHVKLPYIVVIIDEFADLMMTAAKDVETAVARLAQKARAAGIHLILATQRPSTDVITGLIKANFPTRVALRVTSKTDSRVILDSNGAEALLGNGDMLFVPPGSSNLQRVHGAFVSENEIEQIVKFLKNQGKPIYDESILLSEEEEGESPLADMNRDEHYEDAVRLVVESRQASISMIQRRLQVGYNRAARMVEMMELEGFVSAPNGAKPREVLIDRSPY